MKITRIETIRSPDYPNLIWVQLQTDDKLSGLGETYYLPAAVEAVIHDFAAPLLLGQSAFDRERHWQTLFSHANFFGYAGAEMRAISAIDLALWDLLGKATGQTVMNLLGGQTRETIRIYNTCVNTPAYADQDGFLQKPAELAQSLLAQGVTAMKVWPISFARLFRPRLRCCRILMKSSSTPTTPSPVVRYSSSHPEAVGPSPPLASCTQIATM